MGIKSVWINLSRPAERGRQSTSRQTRGPKADACKLMGIHQPANVNKERKATLCQILDFEGSLTNGRPTWRQHGTGSNDSSVAQSTDAESGHDQALQGQCNGRSGGYLIRDANT